MTALVPDHRLTGGAGDSFREKTIKCGKTQTERKYTSVIQIFI